MNLLHVLAAVTVDKDTELKSLPRPQLLNGSLQTVLQLVFGAAGGVAFLIVVIAGFQYVLSQGDPQKTARAKNAVIYAIVGLIICISAFSIVSFVVGGI
jgi:hypothetical protein